MSSSMSDSQFNKSFGALLAGGFAIFFLLIILANIVANDVMTRKAAEKSELYQDAIAARIAPVGSLSVGEQAPASAPATSVAATDVSGESVYQSSCAACHGAGIAGAPKFGDPAAWGDRIAKGNDALYANAINGYQGSAGMMPAKGGNTALSDAEVEAAVDYIVQGSQ